MDIPPLVEISSNSAWIFGLFLVFLLVFHIWLVYWKPIGNIGWKRVDYIWLGVVAIGLVGQSAQVRQLWYASAHDISQYRVRSALMDLKHQANFSIGPAICRTFTITEYSSKNTAQTQAEYNFACVEFTKLTKEVRTSEENREVGFLNLMDVSQTRKKLTDSILIETLDNLKSAYDIFLNALDEKSYNKHQVQTTPYEFVLAILSPFLLMLALALRITKVTGEIRLSKNSAHRYP